MLSCRHLRDSVKRHGMETGWHGFQRFVDAAKATLWLGTTLSLAMWGILTYALDGRYAPAQMQEVVADNANVAKQVRDELLTLQEDVRRIEAWQLSEKLFLLRERLCKHSGGSGNYLVRELRDMKESYRALTGADWIEPACRDLVP